MYFCGINFTRMRKRYEKETEALMKQFYETLSEKDARRYAAQEAQKLGHGGVIYISELFGTSRNRIHQGLIELKSKELLELIPSDRQRKPGGGRKKKR